MNPLLRVGDVLTLQHRDWAVGDGTLRLKVTHVPRYANFLTSTWVTLHGLELAPDGRPMRERCVLVRVQAVRDNPPARLEPGVREL
ncbi:hypothetical protein [Micromonospora sp. NPDC002575]|uniref:hypothetical protein n=1 Tax=Micromonospora sp. NPDC002575 TaxID=3364222 RepID=UPI003693450C